MPNLTFRSQDMECVPKFQKYVTWPLHISLWPNFAFPSLVPLVMYLHAIFDVSSSNHPKICQRVMNRNVPVVLVKVLINWYDIYAVFVRWNNVLSIFFIWCVVWDKGKCCFSSFFQCMLMIWYKSFVIRALDVLLVMFIVVEFCMQMIWLQCVNSLQRMIDTCVKKLHMQTWSLMH